MPPKQVTSKQVPPKKSAIAPVRITWTWLVLASLVALVLSLVASYLFLSPAADRVTEIQVDETKIYIFDDFFPDAQVEDWKQRMEKEFVAGNWFFTTNNNGLAKKRQNFFSFSNRVFLCQDILTWRI